MSLLTVNAEGAIRNSMNRMRTLICKIQLSQLHSPSDSAILSFCFLELGWVCRTYWHCRLYSEILCWISRTPQKAPQWWLLLLAQSQKASAWNAFISKGDPFHHWRRLTSTAWWRSPLNSRTSYLGWISCTCVSSIGHIGAPLKRNTVPQTVFWFPSCSSQLVSHQIWFHYSTAATPVPRFRALRRRHIRITASNPKAKPRHEVINTKLYVEQENQSFCDVFQARSACWCGPHQVNKHMTSSQQRAACTSVTKDRWFVTGVE